MDPHYAHQTIFPAAYALLPPKPGMHSDDATAVCLAIWLQESDLQHRRQLIGPHRLWWESLKGPAHGYPQFEITGVRGVMNHHASREMAADALDILGYPHNPRVIHRAIVHNDILAAVFTRLALWRLPQRLPGPHQAITGLRQYLEVWRPGKPDREAWFPRFHQAQRIVRGPAW